MSKKRSVERALACAMGIVTVLATLAGCTPVGRATPTVAATVASTPSPNPGTRSAPTATRTVGQATGAQAIAADAVARLRASSSYEFTVTAVHRFTSDGKAQEIRYTGEGAFAPPNRYRADLEGGTDVSLLTIVDGQRTYCADTRGARPTCSPVWGGPGPGSSPYTIIAYLLQFGKAENAEASLAGTGPYHLRFSPMLSNVAALGAEQAQDLSTVKAVLGEVWVDRASGLPTKETALVQYTTRTGDEASVEVTLEFTSFNQPVEFKFPPG